VKAGDVVVWRNKDPFPHTATARVNGRTKGFDSQAIAPGQSWTYTAKARGEFDYICSFHPTMTATLRVE
jgi:plastocyanin